MAAVFRGSIIYGDAGGTATASLLLVRSTNSSACNGLRFAND